MATCSSTFATSPTSKSCRPMGWAWRAACPPAATGKSTCCCGPPPSSAGWTLLGAAAALQLAAVPVLRVALGDSVDVDDLGVSPDPHGDLGRGARARIQFRPRLGAELQRPVGQPVLRYGGVAVRSFAQADRAHRSYLCTDRKSTRLNSSHLGISY